MIEQSPREVIQARYIAEQTPFTEIFTCFRLRELCYLTFLPWLTSRVYHARIIPNAFSILISYHPECVVTVLYLYLTTAELCSIEFGPTQRLVLERGVSRSTLFFQEILDPLIKYHVCCP